MTRDDRTPPGLHSAEEALALVKSGRVREAVGRGESDHEERLAEMLDGMPEGEWDYASAADISAGIIEEGNARFPRKDEPTLIEHENPEQVFSEMIVNSNLARAANPRPLRGESARQAAIATAITAPYAAPDAPVIAEPAGGELVPTQTLEVEDDEGDGIFVDDDGVYWSREGDEWERLEGGVNNV